MVARINKALGFRGNASGGKLSFDSPTWGLIRLFIIGLAVLLFMSLDFLFYRLSTLPGMGLRYVFLPVIVILLLFIAGIRYIKFAYGLKSIEQATTYFLALLFGFGYPRLVVRDGEKQTRPGVENLLDVVGGPGYLVIQPGNVVVVENLSGFPKVLGPGRRFITRLESVKEVVYLEERGARVEKMSALTKDGIPVEVKEVRYRYRILRDPVQEGDSGTTTHSPYLYSEDAVLNNVYNRVMNDQGVATWHTGINTAIESGITDYISMHFVDHLTAPVGQGRDPRSEIYERLRSGSVRGKLRVRGAELVWIDIGHFDVPDKQVAEQRVNTWQAKWIGNANIVRAYGESQRLAYQELGRAEAQAEMLMSIVHALEDVGSQGDSQQHMRKVILARIARLIDAMREQETRALGEGKVT
jgi:hypothetical protein